jgi:hypothetical protein
MSNFHRAQKKNRGKAWRGFMDDISNPQNAVPLIVSHTIALENLIDELRKTDLHLQGRIDDEGKSALQQLADVLSGKHAEPVVDKVN